MELRDYQQTARDRAREEWLTHRSTMIVMATGLGKTTTFAHIVNDFQPRRSLVIAHRKELIDQAVSEIEKSIGLKCSVEMAQCYAEEDLYHRMPVVVGTVQTLAKRMTRFRPQDFGLLVIDEFHHSTAKSYRKVLDYFLTNPDLKVLGVTATPERADEEALSQVCESVAFQYGIQEAVHDGWLVDVTAQFAHIGKLDLSEVHTTAGDLNQGELAAIMEADEIVMGTAQPVLEVTYGLTPKSLSGLPIAQWKYHLENLPQRPRRGIAFTVSVEQAKSLSALLNIAKPGLAEWVCGATPPDDRTDILKRFQNGKTAICVNCAVLTEGYNNPGVEVIFMARPTKSRTLYQQMVGRSTRALPGLVDGLAGPDERKAAIAASDKPFCRIIDLCGNTGRHKLISAFDVLGGHVSDDVVEAAIKKAKKDGKPVKVVANLTNTDNEVKAKRKEQERKRAMVRVDYSMQDVNVFGGNGGAHWKPNHHGPSATEKQIKVMRRAGVHPDFWSKRTAGWIIGKLVENKWQIPQEMAFVKLPKRKVADVPKEALR